MNTQPLYFNNCYTNSVLSSVSPQLTFQPWLFDVHHPVFPFLNTNWSAPNFKFNFNFSSISNNNCGDSFVKTSNNTFNICDYNAQAGKKLAQIALRDSAGFHGQCATYVKNAIQKANLGEYQKGDAYKMTSILKNNPNFKEISPNSVNVHNLPAGCVLVYNKGQEGYSQKYGHTEITIGDGRAVSDGITKNLCKQPSAVFVPVNA